MNGHTRMLALAALTICGGAEAQQFQSYSEAINALLTPESDDFASGPFDPPGTSCRGLASGVGDLAGLGPDLLRNCTVQENGAYGSTRSLGFSSNVPTSTFLPFESDRSRTAEAESGRAEEEDTGIRISSRGQAVALSFSAWAQGSEFGSEATRQEARQRGERYDLGLRVERDLSSGNRAGVAVTFGATEQRSDAAAAIDNQSDSLFGPPAVVSAFYERYRQACGRAAGGSSKSREIAAYAYYDMVRDGAASLTLYAGAATGREAYHHDLCYYTVQDTSGPIFASRISGGNRVHTVAAGASYASAFRLGSVVVTPGFSLNFSRKTRPGFRESEVIIEAVREALPPGGGIVPTGAALEYETRHEESLLARLGGSAHLPVGRDGLVSLGLFYVKDFFDDPRTIRAKFVQDLRPAPVRFSFLTNPPPSDYFEVGLKYSRTPAHGRGFGWELGTSAILGDDIYDGYTVSAALTRRF